MPDEIKPVSAVNASTGEAATLRGEERCRYRFEESPEVRCALLDGHVDAHRSTIPPATVSEGACECQTRKALTLAINTVECASIDLSEGPTKGDELPWYKAARAALSAPCPREGLREDLEEALHDERCTLAMAEGLRDECDSLRAELAALQAFKADAIAGAELMGKHLMEGGANEDRLEAELAASQEREREVAAQLEFDRTALAGAITGIKKAFDSRFWLTEGRGSYEWDDDRYREEFREAYQEISRAIEPLKKIAADWAGCPRKAEDVAQARIDLKRRAESAEERERVLREALYRGTDHGMSGEWFCASCSFDLKVWVQSGATGALPELCVLCKRAASALATPDTKEKP